MAAESFTFKLTAEGKKFQKELEELKRLAVYVGYQQGQATHKSEDGRETDMADIALFNELGTAHSPSRPFLRNSINNHTDELSRQMEAAAKRVLGGETAKQVLNDLGLYQKKAIQEEIRDGSYEPNKDSTIARKGSSRPLIDTGQMRQSVNYVVREDDG